MVQSAKDQELHRSRQLLHRLNQQMNSLWRDDMPDVSYSYNVGCIIHSLYRPPSGVLTIRQHHQLVARHPMLRKDITHIGGFDNDSIALLQCPFQECPSMIYVKRMPKQTAAPADRWSPGYPAEHRSYDALWQHPTGPAIHFAAP